MKPTKALLDAVKGRSDLINDTSAEVRKLLREAERSVVAILAGAPSDYQAWYLPQILGEIRRVLTDTGAEAATLVGAAQGQAWQGGADMVDSVVGALIDAPEGALSLRALLPALDTRQLEAMRSFLTELIADVPLDSINAINTQLGLVTIGAQAPFDAVQAISKLLKAETDRRATTIVHTELARAYSTANQLRMEQTAELVPSLRKRWIWSGKLSPRPEHLAIDGQEQPVDKPFVLEGGAVTMMYPHDPSAPARHTINCGCVAVPVLAEDNPYGLKSTIDRSADEAEKKRARDALNKAKPQ